MANHQNTEDRPAADSATPEVASTETPEQVTPVEQPVKAAFNPFAVLTVDELTALAGSYNKQWRQAHALDIALAMTEHGCSENEAIFYAALKADAQAIMDRASVNDAVDSITGLLRGVAFPKQRDVSLALIEGHYSGLKTELRKSAGIRIRDFAHKEWEQVTADSIMSPVYKHLSIMEKDWMR